MPGLPESRRVLASVGLGGLILLAGCGGGSTTSSASAPSSPADLAAKIGCTSYEATTPTMYAREEGGCTMGGGDLDVVTFADNAARDSWLKVAQGFGGVYVVGDRFAVSAESQASAETVKAKVGGDVR